MPLQCSLVHFNASKMGIRIAPVLIFIAPVCFALRDLPMLLNNELSVDPYRELPGAYTVDCIQGSLIFSYFKRSSTLLPHEALTQQNFQTHPFTSQAVVPGSLVYGGEGRFLIAKMTNGVLEKRTTYALEISEGAVGESAYWLPQGGVIDIPHRPAAGLPKYVFTADYSGCSWTVTPMRNGMLRLRHVERGKEVQQFNNLTEAQKGGPITYAMQFKDYGYIYKNGLLINHIAAYAYVHFSDNKWTLCVQHQTCVPRPRHFVYKLGQIDTCLMTYYNQYGYSEIAGTEFFRFP